MSASKHLVVGLGKASQRGILIRNGAALEALASARIFVFDKTGTLTEGRPRVVGTLHLAKVMPEVEWIGMAAAVEKSSQHPLGAAMKN